MSSAAVGEAGLTRSPESTYEPVLDARIAAMRRLLDEMATSSTSEALSILRDAFPDAPLDERVMALTRSAH